MKMNATIASKVSCCYAKYIDRVVKSIKYMIDNDTLSKETIRDLQKQLFIAQLTAEQNDLVVPKCTVDCKIEDRIIIYSKSCKTCSTHIETCKSC
jgi:hypothetical protein